MKKIISLIVVIIGILLSMSITVCADIQISDINSGWYWPTLSSVKPNVTTRTKYTNKKIPPPYCAARYGNLHRLPNPTALPAAARTKPILPLKLPLFVSFIC